MILVTFALPQEGAIFEKRLKAKRIKNGITTGLMDGRSVGVYWLGMGFQDPERFRGVVSEFKPEVIINSGFAGAVCPEFQPGDFILADNATSAAFLGRFRETSFFDGIGSFREVREVIDPAAKARLMESGNFVAVDMESDRVAAICRTFPYPYMTARMISDRADESIPNLFIGKGVRRLRDVSDVIHFVARMLKLRKRLAERLGKLVISPTLPVNRGP